MATTAAVGELQSLEEWRTSEGRDRVYRSLDSLRWMLRTHRDELIRKGAIVYATGRVMIVPARMDTALIEIGKRDARNRAQQSRR